MARFTVRRTLTPPQVPAPAPEPAKPANSRAWADELAAVTQVNAVGMDAEFAAFLRGRGTPTREQQFTTEAGDYVEVRVRMHRLSVGDQFFVLGDEDIRTVVHVDPRTAPRCMDSESRVATQARETLVFRAGRNPNVMTFNELHQGSHFRLIETDRVNPVIWCKVSRYGGASARGTALQVPTSAVVLRVDGG